MLDDRLSAKVLTLTRVSIGWLFFYAGITKVMNPEWSAAGYLNNATTFPGFYKWLASPSVLPLTNFLNEWGLTLIGVALMLGAFTYISGKLGALMMLLYWLPILDFPWIEHGFIVDHHVVYACVLLFLAASRAGRTMGLDAKLAEHPFLKARPKLAKWLV